MHCCEINDDKVFYVVPWMHVIILNKPIYVEDVSGSVSKVFAHEHDLVYDENSPNNLVTVIYVTSAIAINVVKRRRS
jgi:hypothetical protein